MANVATEKKQIKYPARTCILMQKIYNWVAIKARIYKRQNEAKRFMKKAANIFFISAEKNR